jgi:hypothetical protein
MSSNGVKSRNYSSDKDTPISASKLKAAIENGLTVLGEQGISNLIAELARNEIDLLDSTNTYSMAQIEEVFNSAFGLDAAPLLLEKIERELEMDN